MSEKEVEQHLKRWENWNKEIQLEKLRLQSKEQLGKFADNIVEKLNKPLNPIIQKSLKEEVESINSCGICLELMLSPKQPYSLYPCGHSFCRECLFKGKDPKNKRNISLQTCPYCRQLVAGCALNLSLMKMIKKAEGQQQQMPEVQDMDQQSMQIRYRILQKELRQMRANLDNQRSKLQIKEKVETKLLDDRANIRKQIQKLKQQDQLIQTHLSSNMHEIKLLRQVIENTAEKYLLLEKTLESVRVEREKLRLLKK